MEGVYKNARTQQDNVLIEYLFQLFFFFSLFIIFILVLSKYFRYECALIQSEQYGVPVFPVFLAEFEEEKSSWKKFMSVEQLFPDLPHTRDKSAQSFINRLWYV